MMIHPFEVKVIEGVEILRERERKKEKYFVNLLNLFF